MLDIKFAELTHIAAKSPSFRKGIQQGSGESRLHSFLSRVSNESQRFLWDELGGDHGKKKRLERPLATRHVGARPPHNDDH